MLIINPNPNKRVKLKTSKPVGLNWVREVYAMIAIVSEGGKRKKQAWWD